jgi:antitoxin component YwqK of YwqJK toxin-antitoxin module
MTGESANRAGGPGRPGTGTSSRIPAGLRRAATRGAEAIGPVLLTALLAGACAPASERVATAHDPTGAHLGERTERLVDGAWTAEGPFRATHPDGSPAAEGRFHAGLAVGRWRTRHPGGGIASEGGYLLGRREGVWLFRDADGALDDDATGVYEDGERIADWQEEGLRRGMLRGGTLQEATYAGGLRNGPARGFHANGAIESEGGYVDGLRSGRWTYWNEDGSIDHERCGEYALDVRMSAPSGEEGG